MTWPSQRPSQWHGCRPTAVKSRWRATKTESATACWLGLPCEECSGCRLHIERSSCEVSLLMCFDVAQQCLQEAVYRRYASSAARVVQPLRARLSMSLSLPPPRLWDFFLLQNLHSRPQ